MKIMQTTTGMAGALLVTAGMLAAFAANVRADTPPQATATRSVLVRFAHLDLAREADVKALYRQLRQAAKRACGSYNPRVRVERDDWRRCRDAALGDAVARLGNERLVAVHDNAARPRPVNVPRIATRP